jgi:hypothetical protein
LSCGGSLGLQYPLIVGKIADYHTIWRRHCGIVFHTSSTASPANGLNVEVQARVEPAHRAFAERCVPVSPLHQLATPSWDRTKDIGLQRTSLRQLS